MIHEYRNNGNYLERDNLNNFIDNELKYLWLNANELSQRLVAQGAERKSQRRETRGNTIYLTGKLILVLVFCIIIDCTSSCIFFQQNIQHFDTFKQLSCYHKRQIKILKTQSRCNRDCSSQYSTCCWYVSQLYTTRLIDS